MISLQDNRALPHPIKVIRERRGWSQRELSQRAGLAQSTVSGIERRWSKGYPGQLKRLARALGVRVEDLHG